MENEEINAGLQKTPAKPTPIDWRTLLISEVARDPRGKAGVSERLGVSRAYVSRVLSAGTSGLADTPQKFITRVIDRFHVVDFCPATQQPQPRRECHKANGPAPTHNPQAMRVWRCCQTCQHKPNQELIQWT